MADEEKLTPSWGYHRSEEAKIFHLKEGQSLPSGWYDSPAKIPVEPVVPPKKPKATPKPE